MSGTDERYGGTEGEEQALLAALRPTLDDALARERGPLGWWRSRSTAVRAGAVAMVALGVPLGFTALMGSAFTSSLTLVDRVALVGLSLTALTLALALALRPLHRPPAPRRVTVPTTAAALLAPVAVAVVAYLVHGAGPIGPAACLSMGLSLSLPGAALVWASVRATQDGASAFAAGAVAGLGGYLAVGLHCPHVEALHVLLTHGPIVILLGVGAALLAALRRAA